MKKIITDKGRVDEVLVRGVEQIFPSRSALRDLLLSGRQISLYCGFDPSAPSLHIGNAIQLNKLRQFQELGHEVIFLIGDFTGMIGDPTDKQATRRQLTRKEVLANSRSYQKQAAAYLEFSGSNPARVLYNSEWSDKLNFRDLIEISANFTVQQMIQRDMFQERLKAERPIHLHEFLYPLAQGYDSVAMDVDLEIGGNDQMFNMLCGRDLMKAIRKKEKHVMTLKLLADDQGRKMGKSEGNAVNLDENPSDMYGRIMSWPDGVISAGFELAAKIPYAQVLEIMADLKKPSSNPRDFKMKLAFEITRINHGEVEARRAEDHFIKTVQKKEAPDQIPIIKLGAQKITIADLLVAAGLAKSKGEARRLVAQQGIKINNKIATGADEIVAVGGREILLQRGKRHYVKISR